MLDVTPEMRMATAAEEVSRYVGEIAELKTITTSEAGLDIGAAVSLTDAWAAIVAHYARTACAA